MSSHQIRSVAKMEDNTQIQLENWEDVFPSSPTLWWAIGAYPQALRGSDRPFGPHKKGEIFRLTISFNADFEAVEAFEKLYRGEAQLLDYAEKFWNGEKDAELLREV